MAKQPLTTKKSPPTAASAAPSAGRRRAGAAATAPQPVPARRTQEDRSSDTQRKLCQAAVELLSEVGYERLTTAQIAQRAGVSKGAQAHHYPSKDDMLVAAFAHQLAQWEERRERYAARLGAQAGMEDILQNMWQQVFGRPDYLASIELMLAARHHPALGVRLREMLSHWTTARDETFRRLMPIDDPEELAVFLQVNFCVLRGLAVYEGLSTNQALPQKVLSIWVDMVNAYLATRGRRVVPPTPSRQPTPRRKTP